MSKKSWMPFIILLIAASLAGAAPVKGDRTGSVSSRIQEQGEDRARDLYYNPPAGSERRNVGLRVKLYQRTDECGFAPVSPHKRFGRGDSLRFGVESNHTGYLYILQRGTSGETTVLYPHPEMAGGDNLLRRGSELTIPGRGWFIFDENPGREEIVFIISVRKLDLAKHIAPAASAGRFITERPAAGSDEAEALSMIQNGGGRDLYFSPPSAPAPVVSNHGAVQQSVYAVNAGKGALCLLKLHLNHR
jgi:hypothetical protein